MTTTTRSGDPGETAEALVARMTREEKLSFVAWGFDPVEMKGVGYLPGVPRLGIAPLRVADGPVGIRLIGEAATALPAPVALACAFDAGLAREYGAVMGRDGRALGQDMVLAPMVNSVRVPHAGRNFETFGEDPLLASEVAAAQVEGVQSEGLMACVKHFAANNQERDRFTVDAAVGEQVLREIEFPPFRAAVEAGTAGVLAAYNSLNGAFCAENPGLLRDVLRGDWGFEGWVMSDWLGTHSTAAIGLGLDQELGREIEHEPGPDEEPPPPKYFGAALAEAIDRGEAAEADLDRAVARIVAAMARFGLVGGAPPARPERDPEAARGVALRVARAGAVLLRNERGTLPLAGERAADLVVIGDAAAVPKVTGLGSAFVTPDAAAAPLDAIRERAGAGARVLHVQGDDVFGRPIGDGALSPPLPGGHALPAGGRGEVYKGVLTVAEAGMHRLSVRVRGGYATLTLDGDVAMEAGEVFGPQSSLTLDLAAGEYRIGLAGWAWQASPLEVELAWVTPSMAREDIAEAAAAARAARTAVVFAHDDGAEGYDRSSLSLPGHQDALIEAVARANPDTVVVLNTGSAVLMPWLEETGAVLQMWYPGQEGAAATAGLLFGDADPGGRLALSFPAAEDAHPVAGDPVRYPGVEGRQEYSEGLLTGYRWYEATGTRPLFPFGHGLSYARFEYAGASVRADGDGLEVEAVLRNTGDRAGSEVVQVYLGPAPELPGHVEQAPKRLVGHARAELAPGEERRVAVRVSARALEHWDAAAGAWVRGAGERLVQVGASASDIRAAERFRVAP
ncbi:beta-glucosidase family protein [Nocardiopsis potens]|uniref:beta-glucosidase family protein n=1 Tax=Nocardiopsis potens TaxID=1246458 RepID=UPI000348ED90|nr:glycoside hydrolase family 3 C-terminal domain-containing protein [Nocardiopsis potens]